VLAADPGRPPARVYIEQGAPLLLFDPETRPQHVVRFGSQLDLQGIIATSSDADRRVGYLTK
jgi:hypothetical protein